MTDLSESKVSTWEHIHDVHLLLSDVIKEILDRSLSHDATKLADPEAETFAEMTGNLAGSTYGSEEYQGFLDAMKPALDHHYRNNRHHPQHFPNGVDDMNLIDLVEMIADWRASSVRHEDGNIYGSIVVGAKRFNIDPQLQQVLTNTVDFMGWGAFTRDRHAKTQKVFEPDHTLDIYLDARGAWRWRVWKGLDIVASCAGWYETEKEAMSAWDEFNRSTTIVRLT